MKANRALMITVVMSATALFAKTMVDDDHKTDFGKYQTDSSVSVNAHRGWWGGGPGFTETSVENTPVMFRNSPPKGKG